MNKTKQKTTNKVGYTGSIPNTPLRFLWYITKPFKWYAFFAILFSIIIATANQSTNYFFKLIVDAVESGETDKALMYGLAFPLVIFLVEIGWRLNGMLAMNWVLKADEKAHNDLVVYTLGHSHGYFINRFAGSILTKVNNVTRAMEEIITSTLWTHLTALVSFIVSLVFIMFVDRLSGFIFIGLLGALFVVNQQLAPTKRKLSYQGAEQSTVLRGFIVDLFSNAGAVRQFTSTSHEADTLEREVRKYRNRNTKNWLFTEKMLSINALLLLVFGFAMFYALIQKWSAGQISTGDFVLVLGLVSQISGMLIRVGRAFNQTARSLGEASEGLDDLLVEYEINDVSEQKLVVREGKIEWNDVTFVYAENKVFTNFNLVIESGQRIGLVGPSGAGKTTFVSLLLRQHDLGSGSIEIDGQDISKVTQDSLRENIAVVPQEPMLFHRSVRENIAYGKPDATEAEIIEVAKKAQAHEFICSLEDGYNTLVGERGVKLSGGQKQRVAIARAMLKNAPILVLDEATSALDSESEVLIQKALHKLMEGKTVIAVAHRLSTLREMDRIIVLEDGQIVEDGSHSVLSKSGGTYERLWEHQAGGFLQE